MTRAPLRRRPAAGDPRRGRPAVRLRVGFILIVAVLSLFVARLVQLQGVDPEHYAQLAAAQGSVTAILPAERGAIVDRDGQPLADSVDGLMIVADPSLTGPHAARLASLLTHRLGLDYFTTLSELRTKHSRFQYIAREVPAAKAQAAVDEADARGLTGLATRTDPIRSYPGGDVAANIVGFLGTPKADGAATPIAGLEQSFDTYLSGHDGSETYEVGGGNRIPLGHETLTQAQNGHTLHLTIDRNLQWYVQRVLQQTVRGAHADSGQAIVLDSRTAEVLALADYPTYDAADPAANPDTFKDHLYQSAALGDVYEPGSVEKVLTVSGLINSGYVTDRTRFTVPPVLDRGDHPIHDYFEHGDLKLTMAGIIAKSSNIGTVLAADHYRRGQLRKYLVSFGLGQKTNVGLGGESAGLLPAQSSMTSAIEDRMDFGQSLSVNALQMAAAVNAIANGGVRVDPSLVEGRATDDAGQTVGTATATRHRVVSASAAHQMMLMMERVIDPLAGVAPLAAVPGYRVAGKTGTAQEVDPKCGCYDTYAVSFAGFAPADKPRFTVYVVVHNPRNGGGGGSVAGPAFSKIMGYALRRYGVPPTGTKASTLPVEW